MSRSSKKTIIIVLSVTLASIMLIVGIPALLHFLVLGDLGNIYETNNIADYGNITGNYDNETPKKFIFSFFPEKIESDFSQPQYHYKAIKGDSYAYEILLEFVIEDNQVFSEYVTKISNGKKGTPFAYDQTYTDYTISDHFRGSSTPKRDEIAPAGIGKILVNESEQRIIYVATGIYDGDYATEDDLNYYRMRFKGQGD